MLRRKYGKYINFSIPVKKELHNDKTTAYKLMFIGRFKFLSTSLSSLVDNLPEINNEECKECKERK